MKHLIHHVRTEVDRHLIDYLILFGGGLFFILSLHYFKESKMTTFTITVSFAAFYILWGILHHIKNNTLHLKTVIEYILLSFIILFIFKLIIFS